MEFVCYSHWSQLPKSADDLFHAGEKESLFFSRPWFESMDQFALKEDQEMLLAGVVNNQQLLAILPLKKCTGGNWHSLTHNYSSLFSLLISDENQSEILSCLVQGLRQTPLQSITIMPVDQHDSKLLQFQKIMQTNGFECHRKFRFYNWFHRMQGASFAEYMAHRPSRLCNTIARKQRKLEREHDYNIRLFLGEEVLGAMQDYYKAYKASWKADEQFGGILDDLIHRFSSLGWPRLAILYIEDQPAAAQIWFVVNGKANIFRLVYDERWKQYSPGSILTSYLMKYVLDNDSIKEIDFLTGNEQYKQDWMSERRERWALTFVKHDQPQSQIKRAIKALSSFISHKQDNID